MTRLNSSLRLLQIGTLVLMIFLSVISRPRQMLLEISPQGNIPVEFRIVSISIPDVFVLLLLAFTLARLLLVADYRETLMDTLHGIITRVGGLWWALLVVWMVFGVAWANDGTMLRFQLVHLVAMLAMALILAGLVRERGDSAMLWAIIISGVIQSIIAVIQVLNNGPLGLWSLGEIDRFYYDPTSFYRAPGLAMHYNYLAGYLIVALFACVRVGFRRWQESRSPLPPLVAAILISIGILSTLSRSAMIATALGLLPLVLVALSAMSVRTRRLILGVGLAGLVGAVLYIFLALGSLENIATRFFTGREFFFDYSWAVIQTAPITGVGAGNLMLEAGEMWGLTVENLLPVHNVYLYIWAELGVPGLALFVVACVWMLRRLRPANGAAVFIWTACFLAICVVNLFDNYFWAVHPFRVVFFWVIGLWWAYTLPIAEPIELMEPLIAETPVQA